MNENTPRNQPNDDRQKKPGGKPMDQMGQKAKPKEGQDPMSPDLDNDKSQEANKGSKSDQRPGTKQH